MNDLTRLSIEQIIGQHIGTPVRPAFVQETAVPEGYEAVSPEESARLAEGPSAAERLTALAEGAARGATLGLSTLAETAAGVSAEDIARRQAESPLEAGAGEVVGLLVGGPAQLGARLGRAALTKLGLQEAAAPLLQRAGAAAVSNALQSGLAQTGQEAHKLFVGDPSQSAATAAANIGLAGLAGGVLGGGAVATLGGAAKASQAAQAGLDMVKKSIQEAAGSKNPVVAKILTDYIIDGVGAVAGLPTFLRHLGKVSPEAAQLGMARVLGSVDDINGPGARAVASYAQHLIKGAQALNKATKAVFNPLVAQVVPEIKLASGESRSKLETRLRALAENPIETAEAISNEFGPYLANEAGAAVTTLARAASYLSSIKPRAEEVGPLGPIAPISQDKEAKYQQALGVAERPLMVLQKIKEGSITVDDVQTLEAVHPELAAMMRERLISQIADHAASGFRLPYTTALGLSLFLGTALDPSLMPTNLQANQQTFVPVPPQVPQGTVNQGQGKALQGLPGLAATGAQAREQNKRK